MRRIRTIIVVAGVTALCLAATALAATRTGSGAANRIIGTPQNDTIDGRGGDDRILGLAGRDRIRGGSGDDSIDGDGVCPSGVTVANYCQSGGSGRDTIFGGRGRDTVNGNGGNDRISGQGGADVLRGNGGNDRLTGGSGRDRIAGGRGNDRIRARDGRRARSNCGPGPDRVTADRKDRVAVSCKHVSRR